MAEPQTRENLAQNPSLSPLSRSSFAAVAADPDPGDCPTAPPADDAGIEDPDLTREPKRRKHCPMALENLDELTSASNSSFGFTFDTKFCGFSAEVTPKFGSFHSIAPEIETKKKKKEEQRSLLDSESEVRGDEEEEKGEIVEREEEEEEVIGIGDSLLEAIGGGEGEGGGLESVTD